MAHQTHPDIVPGSIPESPSVPSLPVYLTERELADQWKVSVRQVQELRKAGDGPKFVRIGRAIRYTVDAINQWVADGGSPDDIDRNDSRPGLQKRGQS